MVPDSLLTCVLDIEKQRKPERPPLFSIMGTGVWRRRPSYSGFTLFAEHVLPDIVMAGRDLDGDLALRVAETKPGHLDHDRETLSGFTGIEIGIVDRVFGGVEALYGVDALQNVLIHANASSILI